MSKFDSVVIICTLFQMTITQETLTKENKEENKLQYKNRTLVKYESKEVKLKHIKRIKYESKKVKLKHIKRKNEFSHIWK